jgi:hypothetical protein
MKTTSKVLTIAAILTVVSHGATTISGVVGASFKNQTGTNITTGSLVMLIADTGNDGFLNLGSAGAVVPGLTGRSGNTITTTQANLTAGLLFGGDTIVTTSLSGTGSIGGIMTGIDITPYVGKNFAVVWFTATPANVTASLAGQYFGMIRLADWTLPGSDSGSTINMSSTDADGTNSFFSTSASATATQVGGGFFTGTGTAANAGSTAVRSAQFQVVEAIPEPSAALLGALGALGLLRRRRI